MISKAELKRLVQENAKAAGNKITALLGVTDENGRRYTDAFGNQILKQENVKINPSEFSLRALAEAFLGDEIFSPGGFRTYMETAGSAAVSPSQFANISGWSNTVGGLIEFKILEAFNNPEYIDDKLMSIEPTNVLGGTKHIGIGNIGDVAAERRPGHPVKMIDLEERWIDTPATVEHSGGVEVTYEAAAQDLTQQIMARASGIGDSIRLRRMLRAMDLILGVTNPYSYKGTAYNTYQAATPWINTVQNNLSDWTDINIALNMFSKMRDPETGLPIMVQPKDLLVMPAKLLTATKIFRDTSVQARTATTQAVVSGDNNPVFGMFNPITSPYAYYRATASDGLALGESAANEVHIMGDFKKAFGYRQFHPLMVESAIPTSHDMLSRRVVAAYFAYERGVPFVREPRYAIKFTAE